jgi:hypothetical protein
LHVKIGSGKSKLVISDFAHDKTGVIELLNGVGGFANVSQITSSLHSDGHGGTLLSLGASGSIDFTSIAPKSLKGSHFAID